MDIESIRFIADQQKEIDSLNSEITSLFMLAEGLSNTMVKSDNMYISKIADFIVEAKKYLHKTNIPKLKTDPIPLGELRIGSIVQFYRKTEDSNMCMMPIRSIFEDNGVYYAKFQDGFCVNVETGFLPVPLTEDHLAECSFRKRVVCSNGEYEGVYSIQEGFDILQLKCGFFFKYNSYERLKPINYLHQLQNIYLDLTGNELEVKI